MFGERPLREPPPSQVCVTTAQPMRAADELDHLHHIGHSMSADTVIVFLAQVVDERCSGWLEMEADGPV